MNLKVRLALLFSLSVFIILMIFSVTIYFLNENFRKEEFLKRLALEAKENSDLYFSAPKPTPKILDQLNQNLLTAPHQLNVSILDSTRSLLYSSPGSHLPQIDRKTFDVARVNQQDLSFEDRREGVLLSGNNKSFVFASGYDVYGRRKSDNLRLLLTFSTIGALVFAGLFAFFYVRQVIKPLEELKQQIEKINEQNLKERIPIRNNNEVSQIAMKFNDMLDRLEQSFEHSKNFVHHASHELRTPLATMLLQTEAALSKILYIEDYRRILYSLREDQQYLIDLTNSLLALSRYEKITSHEDWVPIRIDEILFEVADSIKQEWVYANVNIDFDPFPEDENHLIVKGNESLIKSAMINLLKNAIQYSKDQGVKATITCSEKGLTLHFDNIGRRLSADEQAGLFIPFFRGDNSKYKKGYGLGLSIVKKIIELHGGTISYHSLATDINRFSVFLPTT